MTDVQRFMSLLLVLVACSGGRSSRYQPAPLSPDDSPASTTTGPSEPLKTEPPDTNRRPFEVKTQSYGAFAKQIGADLALISVAQYACDVYNRCHPEKPTSIVGWTEDLRKAFPQYKSSDGCDIPMLEAWCEGRDCPFTTDPDAAWWDDCREEMKRRTCEEIDVPIQCEAVRSLGIEIRPTDFLKKKKIWP